MSPQNAQLMFTQPRSHYNKTRPAYKKTAPTVTEHLTPSQLVSRNKEMNNRDRFAYDKSTTPPHDIRSRYDSYRRYYRSYCSHYRSSYRSPHRHDFVIDIDLAPISEITTFPAILLHPDHLQDQEILDILDLDHTQTQGTILAQFNHRLQIILSTLKYICITLLNWQML